jgi:hypothetical protein
VARVVLLGVDVDLDDADARFVEVRPKPLGVDEHFGMGVLSMGIDRGHGISMPHACGVLLVLDVMREVRA